MPLPPCSRYPQDSWDHVFGDGALGNGQAKLKQFSVDEWGTPKWIGATRLANQAEEIWGYGFPARFAGTAFLSPEEPEPRAMPLKDRAGLNQAQ